MKAIPKSNIIYFTCIQKYLVTILVFAVLYRYNHGKESVKKQFKPHVIIACHMFASYDKDINHVSLDNNFVINAHGKCLIFTFYKQILRRPTQVYNNNNPGGSAIDSIVLGMSTQSSEKVDRFFTEEVTSKLFSEDPPNGLGTDLPAITTQRGRDHGIPGRPLINTSYGFLNLPKNDEVTFGNEISPS